MKKSGGKEQIDKVIDDLREKVRQFEDQYESPLSNRSSRERKEKSRGRK